MRYCIALLTLVSLLAACNHTKLAKEIQIIESFDCEKGEMKPAWYTMGQDEMAPKFNGLTPGFMILVDTNLKATNFISFHEQFAREYSTELDTSDISWTDNWEKLTTKQKSDKVIEKRKNYLIQADSAHILNNQGQQQVWIINNSKHTVTIQMQDWSFMCVLQAKTPKGQWYPIEYWSFSSCGNSYYLKSFPPQTASSFITKLPKEGDYQTKFRYKLLGEDTFYYSNEFDGRMHYCEFVEDSTNYRGRENPQPHFKFDTIIHVATQ